MASSTSGTGTEFLSQSETESVEPPSPSLSDTSGQELDWLEQLFDEEEMPDEYQEALIQAIALQMIESQHQEYRTLLGIRNQLVHGIENTYLPITLPFVESAVDELAPTVPILASIAVGGLARRRFEDTNTTISQGQSLDEGDDGSQDLDDVPVTENEAQSTGRSRWRQRVVIGSQLISLLLALLTIGLTMIPFGGQFGRFAAYTVPLWLLLLFGSVILERTHKLNQGE